MAREDELFKKLNNGDSSALDELVRLYYPDILRYCLWHTRDRQSAEDAVQETFLKAIRHIDSYTHRGKFKAFLYKIAKNTCTDRWRMAEAETLPEALSYEEQGFSEIESELSFYRMIRPLKDNQQEIIILRFVHQLKVREIADILGEPMRTVQSRLRTALKTLEKNLQKGDVTYEKS